MAYSAYLNTGNSFGITFKSNELPIDHTLITKLQLFFTSNLILSSAVYPDCFDFTEGEVKVYVGRSDIIPVGNYKVQAKVFDSDHPDGEVWGLPISIVVKE